MPLTGPTAAVFLRVTLGPDIAIGPGKAALLAGVRDAGSISAAGRAMGMSYKRAWLLIETINACFREPLVRAAKGGSGGGGATLTPLGAKVLAAYERMQARCQRAVAPELAKLKPHIVRRSTSKRRS